MNTEAVVDVACLVLIDSDGRVLAARRPPGKSLGGLWEFPGGKIDPDETTEAALRRELIEELGLNIGPLESMESFEHHYAFGTIRLWPLMAYCEGDKHPTIVLHEHTDARWVDAAEAATMDWAPADLPVLAKIFQNMGRR